MQDTILILDFDAALAGLIARTLRSQQIYCEPVPYAITLEGAQKLSPKGIILAAASSKSLQLEGLMDMALLDAGLPILALGATVPVLCEYFGGGADVPELQSESVTLGLADIPLFENISRGERVLRELVDLALPEQLTSIATATERCIGFSRDAHQLYAVQYPIERNDPDAMQLLDNFAQLVCGMAQDWTEDYIIDRAVEEIRLAAGDGRVLCAVSGGVDSAVCAKLAHMAVGDRLVCILVDTGLFRKDEPETVIQNFMDTLGLVVAYVDAQDTFLKALQNVHTASEKERITNELLRQVYYKQLSYDPALQTLVLGTNYNDTLYCSVLANPLPDVAADVPLRAVEPLRCLFKSEVRRLAGALSLPSSIAERQPFPSTGLALRVFGDVNTAKLDTLRTADAYFSEEIHASGHERRLWQYYATLSENSEDAGGYAAILRACQASGGDAFSARLPYDLLERVTERILSNLPQITRVVYDLTPSQQYNIVE